MLLLNNLQGVLVNTVVIAIRINNVKLLYKVQTLHLLYFSNKVSIKVSLCVIRCREIHTVSCNPKLITFCGIC